MINASICRTIPRSRLLSRMIALTFVSLMGLTARPLPAVDRDTPGTGNSADTRSADKDDQVTLSAEAMKRYGIDITTARRRKLTSHLVAPARVSFNTTAMAVVGCPLVGRIVALKVAVGDQVKKGADLLVVESIELGEAQSDYLQKKTGVVAAEAAVDPAKRAFERAKKLFDASQGITLTELQKRDVEAKNAQNALLIARSAAKAAESKLRLLGMSPDAVEHLAESGEVNPLYTARAPINGAVIECLVTSGELVKPDREKLLVVADLSTLWVLADVPDSRVGEVKLGAKAIISSGDQSVDGVVSKIGLSVDPSTRSVPVRVEVRCDAALRPGMFAQVDMRTQVSGDGKDDAVLVVPSSAVQSVEGGSTAVFIPVKGKENTFSRRLVSVGDSAGGMVSIISGLDAGEQVVSTGTFILKAELGKASAKDDD